MDSEERKVGGAGDVQDANNVSPQKRKAENQSYSTSAPKVMKSAPVESPLGKKPTGISMNIGGVKKPAAINMNIGGPKKPVVAPIKISLGGQPQKSDPSVLKTKSEKVASVFNPDSDSEEEEMPFEAKMRMRNVGRETPTAAGPNSFGKGNLGFCDRNKMIERNLKKQMEELGEKADKRSQKT